MRISLAAAALFLVGAQTLPALAGGIGGGSQAILPCAVVAGQTALPTDVCRHLAAAFLGSVTRIDFSALMPPRVAAPLAERVPLTAAASPMAPGTSLDANAAWQHHLDKGVAIYGSLFGTGAPHGMAYALPAIPAVLWPGGNPFSASATD